MNAAPEAFRNAIATHSVTVLELTGRSWVITLEMPRGRLKDATRLLRGGLSTAARNSLPPRLRIAAKLAAGGKDPAAYLRDGETVSAVSPLFPEPLS